MRILISLVLVLHAALLSAQGLIPSTTQIYFGSVNELNADSLPVTLNNTGNSDITVTGYRFYNTYGVPAFSTLANPATVQANTSMMIYIRFAPRHNIFHNSELIIENNSHQGDIRIDLHGQGHYSKSYYNSSENLEEEALKTELQTITGNNYHSMGYNVARDSMFMLIDNKMFNGQGASQNSIECVYTGRVATGYTDRTDCQSTYSFNTEHTFPQGYFGSAEPMKSDLHHLFPTDDAANNARGSLPFGIVTNPTQFNNGGSKGDNSKFEPRDQHKGHVARAMLYFLIRYSNYTGFVTSANESLLKQWNTQFTTDGIEATRNSDIFTYQHNRNPFVDYPQFADRITSFISNSTAVTVNSIDLPEDTIDFGLVNATVAQVYKYWIVNNGNVPVTLNNFSLDLPVLSFVNGSGNSVTVNPGEAVEQDVQLVNATPGALNGNLSFNTTASGATVNIPVVAQVSLTALNEIDPHTIHIYPNPFTDRFCVDGQLHDVVITDITGRVYKTFELLQNCNNELSDIPAGVYIIHATAGGEEMHVKLVHQ